MPGLAMIKIGG